MENVITSTTVIETRAPLLNNKLKLFMSAMVLANTASLMWDPLLSLYLKELNASVAQIGLFFTLSQIFPLALQILGGWISDTTGRLRSIAIGSIAGVLSYVGLLLAPTWQWVLVSTSLNAVTRSLVAPSFGAYIAEQSSEEQRARVFGMTETIFMLVAVVGPPLGGWLAGAYGFKFMFLCAGLLYLAATLIRVGMARNTTNAKGSPDEARLTLSGLRNNLGAMVTLLLAGGVMTWILITDGVRDTFAAMSFNLESLYLNEIGGLTLQQIGLLGSVFGICSMATNIPAGWLADKKGERVAIALGYVLHFSGILTFIYATNFWGYVLSWAQYGVGVGMMSPAYNSLTSKAVPEKYRGTAFGLISTSLGLFSLPAPAIGAQLWERVSPRFPFQLMAGVAAFIVIPVWFKFKLPDKKQEEQ